MLDMLLSMSGAGGMGGGMPGAFGGMAPAAAPAAAPGFDMGAMMAMMGGGGFPLGGGGGVPAAPADTRPPAERFAAQLQQMREMGFDQEPQCIAALTATGGSVQLAIERILDGRS